MKLPDDHGDQLAAARARIQKLSAEKAQLQLVADVLSELAALSGLKAIAKHTLQILMNAIGGTNVMMFYLVDGAWQYVDVYGLEKAVDPADYPLVHRAITAKAYVGEQSNGSFRTEMTTRSVETTFQTMVFPLVVNDEVFGALVTEGVMIQLDDRVVEQLKIIASYVSLVVRNESLNESRLKRANDELKRKNEALEKHLQEKAALQDQLIQSQKMEAVGTLAGGIAHDFNNILGAIIGYAEMAADLPLDDEAAKYIHQVQVAGERASQLVKQILSFARKHPDNEQECLTVGDVVDEVGILLRATIPSTVQLIIENHFEQAQIMGRTDKLNQVLVNLVTNASHAIGDKIGTVVISVNRLKAAELSSSGLGPQAVRISVKDNGEGIAPELMGRVFEPYFTTKEVGKGTGLGLAVVHGIVTEMGGRVEIESTLGQGTSVHCDFPLANCTAIIQSSTVPPKQHQTNNRKSGLAVVVDDEPSIVQVETIMLERLGFEVVSFGDSQSALTWLAQQVEPPALLVTDLTMPRLTGVDLARRAHQLFGALPIVLMTGFRASIDDVALSAAGIGAVGQKPFRRVDFENTVRLAMASSTSD